MSQSFSSVWAQNTHGDREAARKRNPKLLAVALTAQIQPKDQSLPWRDRLRQWLPFLKASLGGAPGRSGGHLKANPLPVFWVSPQVKLQGAPAMGHVPRTCSPSESGLLMKNLRVEYDLKLPHWLLSPPPRTLTGHLATGTALESPAVTTKHNVYNAGPPASPCLPKHGDACFPYTWILCSKQYMFANMSDEKDTEKNGNETSQPQSPYFFSFYPKENWEASLRAIISQVGRGTAPRIPLPPCQAHFTQRAHARRGLGPGAHPLQHPLTHPEPPGQAGQQVPGKQGHSRSVPTEERKSSSRVCPTLRSIKKLSKR